MKNQNLKIKKQKMKKSKNENLNFQKIQKGNFKNQKLENKII